MVISDRTKGCCSSDLNEPPHPNHDQFAELDAHNFFEADLPPEQHAYRPGRNAQQAAVEVEELLLRGHREVVDANLKSFLEAASYCPPAYEVRSNSVG